MKVDQRSKWAEWPLALEIPRSVELRRELPGAERRYWWIIRYGLSIGYRVGKRGTTWIARARLVSATYKFTTLGIPDDERPADGQAILTFDQACSAAVKWGESLGTAIVDDPREARLRVPDPGCSEEFTVAHAVADYLTWYRKNRKQAASVFHGMRTYVLPALGHVPVSQLTTGQILEWFSDISHSSRRRTVARGKPVAFYPPPASPEEIRQRKNNANRQLVFLQAALNFAYYAGKADSDLAWRRVRRHPNVDKPRTRYLTLDECRRLVDACEPDIGMLVRGALHTGCRAHELTRMKVGDFVSESGKLLVENSKTGYPRCVSLTADGVHFFRQMAEGHSRDWFMFTRANGCPWIGVYRREFQQACFDAGLEQPVTFHILRHTYATHAVLSGVPLIVLARQLGHTNMRMAEKHYLHFAQDFVDAQIKALMPDLAKAT